MKKAAHILLRALKLSGIVLGSLLMLLFLAPYFFPDTVGRKIKQWTNQSIRGDLNFSKARLSFFTHFPSLTLTLYDVDLKGSAPFQQDTLLAADKLGFGVNLQKLIFDHQVSINKIFLNGAYIHVQVSKEGLANYNIYASDTSKKTNASSDSAASLHLEKIMIRDSRLVYNDRSIPMLIQAEHFFYEGTGDLSKSIFDLTSHIRTDSLNFILNNQSYVRRKAIDASLVTLVNTKTLALIFNNNRIRVNKLNIAFTGKLDFLKNGYNINCSVSTENADLSQLITIFPPEYLDWLRKTTVKGIVSLSAYLRGNYIASRGQRPDGGINLSIHDGYIAYQDAKLPVSRLNLQTQIEIPSLDPEKLHLKIDSVSFRMESDFFRGKMESHGLSEPEIRAAADAHIDLQSLKNALGLNRLEMKGQLTMGLSANGKFAKKVIKTSLRSKDTVIASIPSFDLLFNIKNGFVKYYTVSQPVQNIFISMHAFCPDADYHHAFFKIDTVHATAINNFIEGRGIVHASADFPLEVNLKGSLNLGDIRQIYPLDSLFLSGLVRFDVKSSGKYAPQHHMFPKTNVHFSLNNGTVQTKYYPHPVEKLNVDVNATDEKGDLNNLDLSVGSGNLSFEGKPFHFQGTFKNFEDLDYDLSVNGDLDLGKIYQVFNRSDLGLTGFIRAHAHFKGRQSDVENQRYGLLNNSGTLDINNLTISYELFPKPFLVRRGHFRFEQDKMWFETFQVNYGKSDLQVDGFAENVINYILIKNQTLKASFDLKAKNIDLNEFTAYAPSSAQPRSDKVVDSVSRESSPATGVIMIPANLDLTIKAEADKVLYNDIVLDHFQGGIHIIDAGVELTETGFELIGCQVLMNGKYNCLGPMHASFDYHLEAKDFDVQRAYREIKLFHDLSSSAQHASGIISLDYSLSGNLNDRMYPVYPSLKGSGVLSVKKVQFNGWKLFNAVSIEAGKAELKDPDLSKIDIRSSIKNNLITIERLKFKTGGLHIRFEGQTSFENKVNFKMRIGLPPLGIIGIPVRISGSSDNPKIRLGKSDNDPLVEKEE